MAIKNYTTKISAAQTVGEIQEILAIHGAKRVMEEFEAEFQLSHGSEIWADNRKRQRNSILL